MKRDRMGINCDAGPERTSPGEGGWQITLMHAPFDFLSIALQTAFLRHFVASPACKQR